MKTSVSLVFALLIAGLAPLNAQLRCTNADVIDSWGFRAEGTILGVPGIPISGPFVRAAQPTFDGSGKFTVVYERANYGGVIVTTSYDGTYQVNTDCTVNFVVNAPPPIPLPLPFLGVLTDNKNELRIILLAPGSVISGVLRRQNVYSCSVANLNNAYAMDVLGNTLASGAAPTPFRGEGLATFDGAGIFKANVSINNNGTPGSEQWAGTYTLDTQCRLTISYQAAGQSGTKVLEGVITDGGKRISAIRTDDASVPTLATFVSQ